MERQPMAVASKESLARQTTREIVPHSTASKVPDPPDCWRYN